MTVKVENLKRVRDLMASRPAEGMAMTDWLTNLVPSPCRDDRDRVGCGTVGCIGGWAGVAQYLWLKEKRAEGCDVREESLERWLGIGYGWSTLVMMGHFDEHGAACYGSMTVFDQKNSPEVRKATMLHIVDQIIETGTWNWDTAAKATGAVIHARLW